MVIVGVNFSHMGRGDADDDSGRVHLCVAVDS